MGNFLTEPYAESMTDSNMIRVKVRLLLPQIIEKAIG